MNPPIYAAQEIYSQHGGDFTESLKWHLSFGVVVSMPNSLLLGYYCKKDNPSEWVSFTQADCIFVTMCVGNMREACMQIHQHVDWVSYRREFKNDTRMRITDFRKLFNKL